MDKLKILLLWICKGICGPCRKSAGSNKISEGHNVDPNNEEEEENNEHSDIEKSETVSMSMSGLKRRVSKDLALESFKRSKSDTPVTG